MASTVQKLTDKGIATPPKWLPNAIHYESYIGSVAYGASNDTSDYDIVGWAIPPKHIIFPHIRGHILGFDDPPKFEQYMQHHMVDKSELGGKGREYDVTIYGIVKYFLLCMQGNPNMIDSLFVPQRCVLHESAIGHLVRENRHLFLSKGCYSKFKGYAYSQLAKIENKNATGKRLELIKQYGYDVKFSYHVVRLLLECQQILETQNLELDINGAQLREIRNGKWTLDYLKNWASEKMLQLEDMYTKSNLRAEPNKEEIKNLLMKALSIHYGDLNNVVTITGKAEKALEEIEKVIHKYS